MYVKIERTNHKFVKSNFVTQNNKIGHYDVYECSVCGLIGKRYSLNDTLIVDGRKKAIAHSCPNAVIPNHVRITKCHAMGKQFANLKAGSVHKVIDAPDGLNTDIGVWVMGIIHVVVLYNEFEIVD